MRWVTFMLCAACALTLQSTLAPRLEILGCRPDWLLIIVVFFALHARRSDAAVGAWIIGACADLMTIERAGLIALTYLLTAVVVGSIREYFFRYRGLTQAMLTGAASLFIQTIWLIYRHILYDSAEPILIDFISAVVLASMYTAAWAPLFHRILLGMSGVFGIVRPRYMYTGMHRSDRARV